MIPAWPEPPALEIGDCEPFVCLTVDSAVKLGTWAEAVMRYQAAVAACPQVKEENVPKLLSPEVAASVRKTGEKIGEMAKDLVIVEEVPQ